MPRLSAAEQLAVAIKNAALDCDPKMTSIQVAEDLFASSREQIEPFMPVWAIEKLAKLIGKHRAKARRAANPQLALEGMFGFNRLPAKLEAKPGEFVPRAKSTISGFQRWARDLRRTENPALAYANKAIDMMQRHTPNKPRITWAEVLEKEADTRS